jgi:solute carrier family 26 (sodium-independent sulfate anion transporter), member 11
MSLLTGNIIIRVTHLYPHITGPAIASALAILCGAFVFVMGFLRLGYAPLILPHSHFHLLILSPRFIVDFIPLPAIGAFMTGSALNIAVGQVPGLMGITGFSTRDATYMVFINTLKHLGRSGLDAAMGLPALFLLYAIREFCNWRARRTPQYAKTFFFVSTLRTAFTILLFTMISWLVNRHHRSKPKFSILGLVPRGFKHMGVPKLDHNIVVSIAKELPGAVIVLLMFVALPFSLDAC